MSYLILVWYGMKYVSNLLTILIMVVRNQNHVPTHRIAQFYASVMPGHVHPCSELVESPLESMSFSSSRGSHFCVLTFRNR